MVWQRKMKKMKKMKKQYRLIVAALTASVLAACAGKAGETRQVEENHMTSEQMTMESQVEESVSLSDWEGTWNSIEGYYDVPEVKTAMEENAKNLGITFEALKQEKSKESHVEWLGLKIHGDTITFLDHFSKDGGNEIESVPYEFVEMRTVDGESEDHSRWAVFRAKGEAKHPLLIMMPVHGEEEITHFHVRYGSDVEALLAMNDWWPVMAKESSTLDQVITEVSH